jgi:hypothetical protein
MVVAISDRDAMYIKVSRIRPLCAGEDKTVIAETSFLLPIPRMSKGLSIFQETGVHEYSPFYGLPAIDKENILPANKKELENRYVLYFLCT